MASIITFFQNLFAHPAIAIGVFALVSSLLAAVATFLQSVGDTVPGWIGSVISFLGGIGHLLNGNVGAATGSATPPAP